jgi:hypothetical protein
MAKNRIEVATAGAAGKQNFGCNAVYFVIDEAGAAVAADIG